MKILHVLFLDTDQDMEDYFKSNFTEENVVIHFLSNPLLIHEFLSKQKTDLIYLNFKLGKTNGDNLAYTLPEDIPKYLFTENNSKITYDFAQIIHKPYNSIIISDIIQHHLDLLVQE